MTGGPGSRRLRRGFGVAVATALAVGAAVVGPAAVDRARTATAEPEQRARTRTAAAPPPRAVGEPVCPESTYVQQDGTGSYGIRIKANIENVLLLNGWNSASQVWTLTTEGVTGKICGLLLLPSLQVVVQPDGFVYDTSKAVITQRLSETLVLPAQFKLDLVATEAAVNGVTGVQPDGTLSVRATNPTRIEIRPLASGQDFYCTSLVNPVFTSGTSTVRPATEPGLPPRPAQGPWTLNGQPLNGPLVGARTKVVANDFQVPLFDTAQDSACTGFGELLNAQFGGKFDDPKSSADDGFGTSYYDANPRDYPSQTITPAGETQVQAELVITEVDESALPVGPPDTIPGT